MTVGVAAPIVGGWMADRFVRRGFVDGPLRVGMIGAAGMLVSATAYPLMPSAGLAVVWLVAVNFFAALPWGAASTAAAEMVRHRFAPREWRCISSSSASFLRRSDPAWWRGAPTTYSVIGHCYATRLRW